MKTSTKRGFLSTALLVIVGVVAVGILVSKVIVPRTFGSFSNPIIGGASGGNSIPITQTPWTSAHDGAGYALSNAGTITATNYIATSTTVGNFKGDTGSASLPTYSFSGDPTTGIYSGGAGTLVFGAAGSLQSLINSGEWRSNVNIHINNSPSATTPSYSWYANTNTGLYNPVTNTVGVSTNGSEIARFTTSGLGIGTTTPQYKLHVSATGSDVYQMVEAVGGPYTAGTYYKNTQKTYFAGLNKSVVGNYEIYDQTASASRLSILNGGNIGIGSTTPATNLTVQGNMQAVIAPGVATSTCTTVIEGSQVYNLGNHHLWLCMGSEPWTLLK